MKTTIKYNASCILQKKLLSEGKNSQVKQEIELDLQSPGLIEKATIDYYGKAEIYLQKIFYHYNEDLYRAGDYKYFDCIPTEQTIIQLLAEEAVKDERDEIIQAEKDEQAKKKREEEERNERVEKEMKDREKELNQKRLDEFVDQFGTETCRMRKELNFDYEGLAEQEYCDACEPKQVDIERINTENDNYRYVTIQKPSLELMKKMKELEKMMLPDVKISPVDITVYDDDGEYDAEGFKIEYNAFGRKIVRLYEFKIENYKEGFY